MPVLALAALVIISLTGMEVLMFVSVSQAYNYDDIEENVFVEVISVRDTNGSLSSFYHEPVVHDFGSGDFNVTLPSWFSHSTIELNETVVKVRIECSFHWEVFGEHEMVGLIRGADLVVTAGGVPLVNSLPAFEFVIGGGAGGSETAFTDMAVNSTFLASLNTTEIDIAYECMVRTNCEGFYAVNYAFSIRADLWNRRSVTGVSPMPGLTLFALGVISVGFLVLETNRSWPPSPAKSHLPGPLSPVG